MKEFVLPKAGCTAMISILKDNDADLQDALALHDATRAALPADKQRYILPQDPAYFQNLLAHKTGLMIGIRAEGKLIAQMALMGPMPLREAIANHTITHNDDVLFPHAALSDSVVVFKSMASHPDWRGNDLSKNLVSFAIELPFTQVCVHVFAQISAGNKRSWDTFARQKFGIVAAAYDPDDGLPRFVFQRPTFGFDFEAPVMADDVDPVDDFSAIVSLTRDQALVGVYGKNSTERLVFFRNREEEFTLIQTIARAS